MRTFIVSVMALLSVMNVDVWAQNRDFDYYRAENRSQKKSSITASASVSESKAAPVFQYTVYGDIPVAETLFEEEHYLGDAISPKWNTFLSNYTHEYSVEIGFTDSGVELLKPAIYNAVERANKYVRKSLKKGLISKNEAIRIMAHVLDCANVICYEPDTENVEEAAKAAHSGEEVLAFFDKIELVQR